MPDSGATRTIISYDLALEHGLLIDRSKAHAIKAANDAHMACEGAVKFTVHFQKKVIEVCALVSSALTSDILLSWHDLVLLGVLPKNFPGLLEEETDVAVVSAVARTDVEEWKPSADFKKNLDKLLSDYADVF